MLSPFAPHCRPIKLNRVRGFTLVELSIVIVIIGLIVAGVTAGQSLVRQAQIRSIITTSNLLKAAVNSFKMQYNAIPGDMKNSTAYWPSSPGGDGNGRLFWFDGTAGAGASEISRAFEHLSLSGILPGGFNSSSDIRLKNVGYEVGLPTGKMILTSWTKTDCDIAYGSSCNLASGRDIYEKGKIIIMYGKPTPAVRTEVNTEILTPVDAYNIDKKSDDGQIATGAIFAANGLGGRAVNSGLCGNFTVSPFAYDFTSPNTVNCTIGFSLY